MDLNSLLNSSQQGLDPNTSWLGGDQMPQLSDSIDVSGIDPQLLALIAKQTAPYQGQLAPNQQSGSAMTAMLNPDGWQGPTQSGPAGSTIGNILSGAGATAGAIGQNERINRLIKGIYTQDYDKMMLAAQAGRDTDESQSLKHLAQTGYLQGTSGMTLDPGRFSPYAAGMAPKISAAQKQGAAGLEGQLVKRLQPGGYVMPHDLDSYANPGTMENILGYGGAIANMMGGMAPGGSMAPQGGGVDWGNVAKKAGGWISGLFNKGGE